VKGLYIVSEGLVGLGVVIPSHHHSAGLPDTQEDALVFLRPCIDPLACLNVLIEGIRHGPHIESWLIFHGLFSLVSETDKDRLVCLDVNLLVDVICICAFVSLG
jgi:hypothetical protein